MVNNVQCSFSVRKVVGGKLNYIKIKKKKREKKRCLFHAAILFYRRALSVLSS